MAAFKGTGTCCLALEFRRRNVHMAWKFNDVATCDDCLFHQLKAPDSGVVLLLIAWKLGFEMTAYQLHVQVRDDCLTPLWTRVTTRRRAKVLAVQPARTWLQTMHVLVKQIRVTSHGASVTASQAVAASQLETAFG